MYPDNTFLKIDGKTFRCGCGANVFHQIEPDRFACNGCFATYTTEPKAPAPKTNEEERNG